MKSHFLMVRIWAPEIVLMVVGIPHAFSILFLFIFYVCIYRPWFCLSCLIILNRIFFFQGKDTKGKLQKVRECITLIKASALHLVILRGKRLCCQKNNMNDNDYCLVHKLSGNFIHFIFYVLDCSAVIQSDTVLIVWSLYLLICC